MLKLFTYCRSLLVLTCLQVSCNQQAADLIVYNAHIYTMDSALTQATAMAIKDGKIIAVGTDNELKNFEAKEKIECVFTLILNKRIEGVEGGYQGKLNIQSSRPVFNSTTTYQADAVPGRRQADGPPFLDNTGSRSLK